jgi:hypothetical protein
MIGSDYGHADNASELALNRLQTKGEIDPRVIEILYDNPARFYGLSMK